MLHESLPPNRKHADERLVVGEPVDAAASARIEPGVRPNA